MAEKDVKLRLTIQSDKSSAESDISALLRSLDLLGNSVNKLSQNIQQFGAKAKQSVRDTVSETEKLVQKLSTAAGNLATMGASLAAAGASMALPFGAAVKAAGDFENEMNKVRAVADFSPDTTVAQQEFQALTDKARELGTTTSYSASEAAQGIAEFAKAGYNTGQVLAAIRPALNLAFVEARNFGQTAEDLVGILTAFGLGADDMTRATDVLAQTSNATTTSMAGLTEGMKYAAPIAKALGLDIEQTAAMLGTLAQNGFKGEMGGAGLRRVLEDLVKPTTEARAAMDSLGVSVVKTADGTIDVVATFEKFKQANMNAAQASAIFGTQGMGMALALKDNTQYMKDLEQKNRDATGSLQKMTDIMNAGLVPSLKMLKNNIVDLSIQFAGPFLAPIKTIVDWFSRLIQSFVKFGQEYPNLSKVMVGIAGLFTAVVIAIGGLALALSGIVFAISAVLNGWKSLFVISGQVNGFFTRAGVLVKESTAFLRENTKALLENVAATKEKAKAVLDIPAQTPGTVTGKSGLKFSSAGVAGAAATGATIGALSGSEALDVVKLAGISAAIQLIASNADVLYAKLMALVPSWQAVTSVMSVFLSSLKAAGLGLIAAIATPVGVVVTAILAAVGTVAGVYKILNDRAEGAEIQADTMKRSMADVKRAVADGFDPKKVIQQTNQAQLLQDPYEALVAKRKQAVAEFAGVSEQLTQAREKDASSILGGKSEDTQQAEKNLEITRKNLDLIQVEINKRTEQAEAIKKVSKEAQSAGQAIENIFTKEASGFNTLADKLQGIRNLLQTVTKETEVFYASMQNVNDLTLGKAKNEVAAIYQSEQLAAAALTEVESKSSLDKIAIIKKENAVKTRYRDEAYAASKAAADAEVKRLEGDAAKQSQAMKERSDIEKAYREQIIQDEKALGDAIVSEIKKQQETVNKLYSERKQLEEAMRSEVRESQSITTSVYQKSMSDTDKLKTSYMQAVDNLRQANALLPTAPEKAIEMAKKARSDLQGLTQDLESLRKKLVDTFESNQERLRKMAQKTMDPAQAWLDDQKHYQDLMLKAQEAFTAKQFDKAEKYANQAKELSATLDKAPEGTGFTQQQMSSYVAPLFSAAATLEEKSQAAAYEFKKGLSESALGRIGEAGIVIRTAQEKLLDANTKQLKTHGDLLSVLAGQYKIIIDQNNALLKQQGGEQIKAPEITSPELTTTAGASQSVTLDQKSAQALALASGSAAAQEQQQQTEVTGYGTRGENEGLMTYTDLLLKQTDAILAQSKSESEIMSARDALLKYLESQAKNLDYQEKAGYFRNTPETISRGDVDLTEQLKKIFPSSTAGASIFDNLTGIVDSIKAGMTDKLYEANRQLVGGYTTSDIQEQFKEVASEAAETLAKAGDQFMEIVAPKITEVLSKTLQVEVLVNDNRATLGSISRV